MPKSLLGITLIVVLSLIASLFGYSTPHINYSSQQVFCLKAACINGTGFDKECLEAQPRLAQMHVVEDKGSQRVIFEMTDRVCEEQNNGTNRNR
jgi:hypothetical protein